MNTPRPGSFIREDGRPVLAPSVVAYVDVLGISAKATGPDAQEVLLTLDRALHRARQRYQVEEEYYWADSSWFSDNLAIAAALGNDRIFAEGIVGSVINATQWVQFLLAIEGFFMRGGLVVDDHFMDDRVSFGPALVTAVDLEKNAEVPRVIVDESAVEMVEFFSEDYAGCVDNPFCEYIAIDDDGSHFLSYLSVVYEADDLLEALSMLRQHRDAVAKELALTENNGHLRGKYRWLAGYHNYFCGYFAPDETDLIIAGDFDNGASRFEPRSAGRSCDER